MYVFVFNLFTIRTSLVLRLRPQSKRSIIPNASGMLFKNSLKFFTPSFLFQDQLISDENGKKLPKLLLFLFQCHPSSTKPIFIWNGGKC